MEDLTVEIRFFHGISINEPYCPDTCADKVGCGWAA